MIEINQFRFVSAQPRVAQPQSLGATLDHAVDFRSSRRGVTAS